MRLQSNEQVLKVFHHHPLTFVFRGIKIFIASFPFYFLAALLSPVFSQLIQFFIYLGIAALFLVAFLYDFILFYLDRLIITNKRIMHIDWISAFKNCETEASLDDIQDMETTENGFLSFFKIFDYGKFELETASTKTTILFTEAADPEGIRQYIYNVCKKHSGLDKNKNIKELQGKELKEVESKLIS